MFLLRVLKNHQNSCEQLYVLVSGKMRSSQSDFICIYVSGLGSMFVIKIVLILTNDQEETTYFNIISKKAD